MTTFTIDCDNNITAFATLKEAQAADIAGAEYFSSEEELAQLAASWPVAGANGRGRPLYLTSPTAYAPTRSSRWPGAAESCSACPPGRRPVSGSVHRERR